MLAWLGGILKDPEKRAIVSWLGGGAVVVAGDMWTGVTFFAEHKDARDRKGNTNVIVSGQGIASGGDTHITGPVTIGGASKEQIEQIQKPFIDQLTTKDVQIAGLTKMLLEKNPAAGDQVGSRRLGLRYKRSHKAPKKATLVFNERLGF